MPFVDSPIKAAFVVPIQIAERSLGLVSLVQSESPQLHLRDRRETHPDQYIMIATLGITFDLDHICA